MDYAKLKTLIADAALARSLTDDQVEESVRNLAEHVKGAKGSGRFQVRLVGGRNEPAFCLELTKTQCEMGPRAIGEVDFEIRTTRQTWTEISKGELSPVDAYLLGRMEVRGDLGLGKRLLAKASERGKKIDFI